jgi:hypothetical protein
MGKSYRLAKRKENLLKKEFQGDPFCKAKYQALCYLPIQIRATIRHVPGQNHATEQDIGSPGHDDGHLKFYQSIVLLGHPL